jgi:hypothetical protein
VILLDVQDARIAADRRGYGRMAQPFRCAQIWVICAFLPAWRAAALMLGRAEGRAFSSGLCR